MKSAAIPHARLALPAASASRSARHDLGESQRDGVQPDLVWERAERLPEGYAALVRLLPRPPHVGARFPFDQAPEGMRLLQSGKTIGRNVVLQVASPG